MSHSITITISNLQHHIKICDDMLNQLNVDKQKFASSKYSSSIDFDGMLNKVNQLKNEILSNKGKVVNNLHLFYSSLSRYEKEITNLRMVLNSSKSSILDKILEVKEFDLLKQVETYGTLAYETYEYMKNNSIEINEENFTKTLNEVRDKVFNEQKREIFINEAFKRIDDSDLPNDMKYHLKIEIKQAKTVQEISDINPMISSKENEYKRLKMIVSDFNKLMSEQGFKIDKSVEIKKEVDDYSNIVYKYALINNNNNSVKVIINSDGQIKYKLGNYVGHMCNQTTDKLLQKLKDIGYDININSIKRDIDNNKPLMMEMKMEGK